MFHFPSDAIADKSFSLNLIQLDHHNAISPSPEDSPSLSPASLFCSPISSLNAWRRTSDQFQSPIFSFPHPIYRNVAAVSNHEHSGQHISCVPMSALDMPSTQEPAIPSVEEDELGDLHWATGVPCHMMDVFRADPFAAMDPPPTTTIRPPFDNSTRCKIGDLHHATKHVLSPDAVEQKRKTRRKRARIQSPHPIPFPSTGPQEMFAYEFRLEIPYGSIGSPPHEDTQRRGDSHPSFSRAMDKPARLYAPQPVTVYGSEDVSMRSSLEQDVELSFSPQLEYPCSLTASIPPKIRPEYHMQPSHYTLFPVPFSNHMSSRLQGPSVPTIPIPLQRIDEYQPPFDEHGLCSMLHSVPVQDAQEWERDYRLSVVSAASLVQKPLYACPLCPRDFQLPNGLALHLKWHDRVASTTQEPTRCLSRRVAPRQTNTESGPLDTYDARPAQIPVQEDGQQSTFSRLPSIPYVALQEANLARAESVTLSHYEQYTSSALSYERQPQECALFSDALQLNDNVDDNTYLAPLDGLSVLQPLPFEQWHSSTGHLCAIEGSISNIY